MYRMIVHAIKQDAIVGSDPGPIIEVMRRSAIDR